MVGVVGLVVTVVELRLRSHFLQYQYPLVINRVHRDNRHQNHCQVNHEGNRATNLL
eukprot:TRINITY_DN14459_c0_g1_i1.p2 TRINITY_DN14459_c0_g1~~TRINITY_DN14459_c0_g1_i1.p2  ORF type:complete len:56 (+),score=1.60 TRINITY_DN14459_c0_g1_i1:221-388(+)